MSNKISTNNPAPYAFLNDIPPTTPIKPELATTENKVELIHNTDEAYINNIVSEGLQDKLESTTFKNSAISEVSINFDNEKVKKTLINFIPEHNKISPTDGIVYSKQIVSDSASSLFSSENQKKEIQNHLGKLGIDLKKFIILNYKIDLVGLNNKELANELKEKLKFAIKKDSKNIIAELDCELKPINKNNSCECVSIPKTKYPNQSKIEQLKNDIQINNEKIEQTTKAEEGVFTKFESVDKFLDYVSKNEATIPYGSKFGVSLEGSINPAKLLEVGIKADIKIEYSFGKGPSYLAHVDLNSQLSSDLVGVEGSATVFSSGLAFYKIGQIKKFKDDLSKYIDNNDKIQDKIKDISDLLKNSSCILSTHSINLKTTDNSSIKVTTSKGTYPPPPKPTNETIKKIDEGYYKENLLATDIEIESKIKDFTIKIQISDLDSIKPSDYKEPIVKLSVEFKNGIKEINPDTLKKALISLREVVPEKEMINTAISLIDKNKASLNSLKNSSKTLSLKDSIHVSLELNTDQSGIFLNEFVESSTAKNFKDVKNMVKKLPMSITPAVETSIGIRKQLK